MSAKPVVLLAEADAVVRHTLAEYLRECGYRVVEAATTDEAEAYFQSGDALIDAALLDVRASGSKTVFELAQWIRAQYSTDVVMVGAVEAAAQKAGELCESGPTLSRPYEHTVVVDLVKRLRAERDRTGKTD